MTKSDPTIDGLLGEGLIMYGNDPRLEIRRLPTTIPGFDDLLGGGFPAGRYTQIVGPESTCKTVLLQYAVASQQRDEKKPDCLIIDFERSYDAAWWAESGVDVGKLMVAQPMFGEEGIDVILAVIEASSTLGLVGVDSIGAMWPRDMVEPDKGAEQNFVGSQAKVVSKFFRMVTPQMDDIVMILLNQMRASVNSHEENYPGGYMMRHMNHITLRTRRAGWLLESEKRIGFTIEIFNKKNKVGGIQNDSIQIPFKFRGQIDLIESYIGEALEREIVTSKGPYYYWGEIKVMGKAKIRQHFIDHPEDFEVLKAQLV